MHAEEKIAQNEPSSPLAPEPELYKCLRVKPRSPAVPATSDASSAAPAGAEDEKLVHQNHRS